MGFNFRAFLYDSIAKILEKDINKAEKDISGFLSRLENPNYVKKAPAEVVEECQKKIGSRWVITKKESHDGQKTDYKARIVARGFQEEEKPQFIYEKVGKQSLVVDA